MNNPFIKLFYSTRLKYIGVLCIVWGIAAFSYKYYKGSLTDWNLLFGMLSWGLCFIFFSKEAIDDERIHRLKFHSLTLGVPLGLMITHLVNYFFLNKAEPDSENVVESISGFQSITIILILSLATFFTLKFREENE